MNPSRHRNTSCKVQCMAQEETRRLHGSRKGEHNCVSKSGRASAFPAQHVMEKRSGQRAWVDGSSPWNFNQRQLLAGVARSSYVCTFLETQRQNSILPSFSPLSCSFLPRTNLGTRISSSSSSQSLLRKKEIIGRYYLEMREG